MYRQVKQLVHKVGYYSAGTVEFIMDENKKFYFLEMNTRLQVEHCVTELVTGFDIVREMVNIAAGYELTIKQEDVKLKGWAIESRICAEDPSRGFLPSSGRITEYHEPVKSSGIRIDSGVKEGTEVSMFYDSLIAKLCSYGATREEAISKMRSALSSYIIRGISHNISFCEAIMNHPKFTEGDITTKFIEEEYPKGFVGATLTSESTEVFLAAAIHIFIAEQRRALNIKDQIVESLNKLSTRWIVNIDNNSYPVFIKSVLDGFNIRQGRNKIHVRSNWVIGSRLFKGEVNGRSVNVKIEHINTGYLLNYSGIEVSVYVRLPRIAELEALMQAKNDDIISDEIIAPLSGQIISVRVKEGDHISIGQELFILAAMKMENIVYSEREGTIAKIHIKEQDNVNSGQLLIEFA
jgi:propionyl-CoA carboxylase alpha chain